MQYIAARPVGLSFGATLILQATSCIDTVDVDRWPCEGTSLSFVNLNASNKTF